MSRNVENYREDSDQEWNVQDSINSTSSNSPLFNDASRLEQGKRDVKQTTKLTDDVDSNESSVFGQDRDRLQCTLKQRHIQMLALIDVFGTGIFLSSGGVLATTGPAGMLLAYAIVAIIVGMNQMALAEVASLMPVSSATVRHLEQFIDPAWSFAFGWISVWSCMLPGQISSSAVLISYWTDISEAAWITIIIALILATNSYNIRFYAEIEFGFAIIKIMLLAGLIIISIVITSGGGPTHEVIGFKFWHKPGPFNEYIAKGNLGKFIGFWKVLTGAVYSYGGVQSVPALAAETENPRRTVFSACKRIFYRSMIIMLITVLCLTLIVASDDPKLTNSTGNAQSSPFVIAVNNAKIKVVPHIINAGILTSAFSDANLSIVHGARTMFALAVKRQAPRIFLKTNRNGLPWVGTIFFAAFTPLAYMNVSKNSANVFNWFQTLSSANYLLGWILMSANHIHMTRAMKVQGISRDRLPHKFKYGPQAAWISGIAAIIVLITGGFKNFIPGHFQIDNFFAAYFILPFSFGLFLFWKIFKKTRYLRPHEVDLAPLFKDVEENPEPPAPKLRSWDYLKVLLWA
ncbi:dicarboxylic amino acid permease [Wickerhamomyces ciferrii]|uniref:Dicarboxylic amino acid permease n=1 Tax=Wickerhamomyces ciferrii (strain ATCC 14091 / BCRC 22168 / CBS 111 / JCM 3599 / NBRC 0793 / NRRL Y-1031 F-60-10) TaxID=1206466 RepID=K0KF22_WICCF|nr:dicarboxylic amino acid permease [Wickerhamomyces ciferrii]CCH43735.1 dicarboxylic amino acid permease [Wickerhamomyces ciferrii]